MLVLGLFRGQPFEVMLVTAISLVVAAVPESLPVVATWPGARGAADGPAQRRSARLAAVETLGSVTLLATDKTGTLTQGRMGVSGLWRRRELADQTARPAGGVTRSTELLQAMVLCNDATLAEDAGDQAAPRRPHRGCPAPGGSRYGGSGGSVKWERGRVSPRCRSTANAAG